MTNYTTFNKDDIAVEDIGEIEEDSCLIIDNDFKPKESGKGKIKIINPEFSKETGLKVNDIIYFDFFGTSFIKELKLIIINKKNILLKEI